VVAAVAILAAVALALAAWFRSPPASPVIRSLVAAPENTIFDAVGAFGGPAVISPNGRARDALAAQPLAGAEGA
jgi:hypothetical protein